MTVKSCSKRKKVLILCDCYLHLSNYRYPHFTTSSKKQQPQRNTFNIHTYGLKNTWMLTGNQTTACTLHSGAFIYCAARLPGLTGSAVGYGSIIPGLKPGRGFIRMAFRLSLRLIAFGGRSAHLAYLVHRNLVLLLSIANQKPDKFNL